jgi:hypothetical protein
MSNVYNRLEQAILAVIESYTALEAVVESKYGDDEDSYSNAIIEALEASIESAIDDGDIGTNQFATILSNLNEALEQLDPSAFEDDVDAGDFALDDIDDSDVIDEDIDYEDEELDDIE